MKTFLTFLVICFFSVKLYSQEIPRFNIGVGYPFLIPFINYSTSGGEISFEGNRLNLSAEIPALIKFKRNPGFFISAGLSYIYLHEYQDCGCLGGDGDSYFDRNAFSIYTKLVFNPTLKKTNNNWSFGLITGRYLYTHVSGNQTWMIIQEGPDYHGSREIDMDSKYFFKSYYFGFTTSYQFNFEKLKFLKPAIEISFYPDYANIVDEYSGDTYQDRNHSMLMGSIILGLGSKLLSKESEK